MKVKMLNLYKKIQQLKLHGAVGYLTQIRFRQKNLISAHITPKFY